MEVIAVTAGDLQFSAFIHMSLDEREQLALPKELGLSRGKSGCHLKLTRTVANNYISEGIH